MKSRAVPDRAESLESAVWCYNNTQHFHLQSKQMGRNDGHSCTKCWDTLLPPAVVFGKWPLAAWSHSQLIYRRNIPGHMRSPNLWLLLSGTCPAFSRVYLSTALKTVEMLGFEALCRYILLHSLQFLDSQGIMFLSDSNHHQKDKKTN